MRPRAGDLPHGPDPCTEMHMPRWIALVAGTLILFVGATAPVAAAGPDAPPAAPQSTAPANGVPDDAVGLAVTGVTTPGLALSMDSGARQDRGIVVSNHTADLRLSIKLSAADATGRLGAGPAGWLSFADTVVQLEPHAARTIPMTIAIPHSTQPGPTLAHVTATVQSAVAAADGSPRGGTADATFPVSINVTGTATATIAIVDVHRTDKGDRSQLAVVLRNFGNERAHVTGTVRVGGAQPQTIPLEADLDGTRDTTVNLDWKAPPEGTPTEIGARRRRARPHSRHREPRRVDADDRGDKREPNARDSRCVAAVVEGAHSSRHRGRRAARRGMVRGRAPAIRQRNRAARAPWFRHAAAGLDARIE
jgi:hypothetical protein